MTVLDLTNLGPVTTTTTSTTVPAATPTPARATDFLIATLAWVVVIVASATVPLQASQVTRAALFIHLVAMAIGFGSVVMIDVYGLMWLFGYKTLYELVDLAAIAHGVISVGIGGLLASGVALRPDLSSPLARCKLLLVLVVMLNGVWAQRVLHGMKATLPPDVRGANIPWAGFQKALTAALISQASWWGSIAIGFLTNASRHA
jgi:hypothetical protein